MLRYRHHAKYYFIKNDKRKIYIFFSISILDSYLPEVNVVFKKVLNLGTRLPMKNCIWVNAQIPIESNINLLLIRFYTERYSITAQTGYEAMPLTQSVTWLCKAYREYNAWTCITWANLCLNRLQTSSVMKPSGLIV
jgi:hypothetical protein